MIFSDQQDVTQEGNQDKVQNRPSGVRTTTRVRVQEIKVVILLSQRKDRLS